MPNSAGVVGPDYLTPIDLDFGTATLDDVAQAMVDLYLVEDSTATITPTVAGDNLAGPDYIVPESADLSGVIALATLVTAAQNLGIMETTTVTGPDYLAPTTEATTLGELLTALADSGYVNDTSA